MGVALQVDWTVTEDLAEGRLVSLFPKHRASGTAFDVPAWIVYRDRGNRPARQRADDPIALQSSFRAKNTFQAGIFFILKQNGCV